MPLTETAALYQWTPSSSVGVAQFDRQHRHLFEMLNDLNSAMQAGQGKAVLGNIIMGLVAYTKDHFEAEELAMQKTSYAGFAAHHQEHADFTGEVSKFLEEFQSGNRLISIDVLRFLNNWLTKHILGSDKAYTAHLNSKGIH